VGVVGGVKAPGGRNASTVGTKIQNAKNDPNWRNTISESVFKERRYSTVDHKDDLLVILAIYLL